MKSIGEFFARIRGKQMDEMRLRLCIQEIIERYTKIKPTFDDISFSIKAVSVKGLSQAAKSAIYVKKTTILKEIEKAVPSRQITDIRLG